MSAASISLFLLATSLVTGSAAEPLGPRAAAPRRRVPVGGWIDPARRERRDDALAALAQRSVVLLGEQHPRPSTTAGSCIRSRRCSAAGPAWSSASRCSRGASSRFSTAGRGASSTKPLSSARSIGRGSGASRASFTAAVPLRPHASAADARANVDRATNRRVAAQGFAATPSAEREGVGDPAPASPAYRARLFEWFKRHPGAGDDPRIDGEPFERFVRGQTFWDRAMAEAIAGAARDPARPLVVAVLGAGHVEYGDGVARQLAALGVDDVATALPWRADADTPAGGPPIADLVFGVAPPA